MSENTENTNVDIDPADVTHTFAIYREERREETGNMLAPQFVALRDYTDRELLTDPDSGEMTRASYDKSRFIMEEAHRDNPEVYGVGTWWVAQLPADESDDWDKRYFTMHRVHIRAHTTVSSY